jgi:phosphatidylserine synthase 2
VVHFWSLFYELIELSAKHRLPHFAECWWDSLLTDVLFSNTPAIMLGLFLLDYFGVRRYDWLGRYGKASVWDWDVLNCHRRFGNNCLMLVLFSLHFLCSFFLMNALLVPPTHLAVACRMLLWAGIGSLGFREAYIDLETWNTIDRKHHAVEGRYRWLATAIIATEGLISYKYREGTGHITDTPTPWYIWMPWTFSTLALVCGFLYLRFKPDHTVKYPGFGQPEVTASLQQDESESPRLKKKRTNSPSKKTQ